MKEKEFIIDGVKYLFRRMTVYSSWYDDFLHGVYLETNDSRKYLVGMDVPEDETEARRIMDRFDWGDANKRTVYFDIY